MTPDEVLSKLAMLGINTSERTLQRYVKDELIPMPERKSGGRGMGRITDYVEGTPAEFYASFKLRHEFNAKSDLIAKSRQEGLGKEKPINTAEKNPESMIVTGFSLIWISLVQEAKKRG